LQTSLESFDYIVVIEQPDCRLQVVGDNCVQGVGVPEQVTAPVDQ
jgi:hypothetical protein